MNGERGDFSFAGITIPINRLYIILTLVGLTAILLAGKIYFYDFEPTKRGYDLIVAILVLVIIGIVCTSLGLKQWIPEDKEERELRRKRRGLEHKKLEAEMENIERGTTDSQLAFGKLL
ncbi:MAG: hypothetical protein ABIG95_04000 [Candidatus Woesearchaeota archaeon]